MGLTISGTNSDLIKLIELNENLLVKKHYKLHGVLVAASLILTSCANTSSNIISDFKPELIVQYDAPLAVNTNNEPAFVDHLNVMNGEAKTRQMVIISSIGDGGAEVATLRAKNVAAILSKNGEINPLLYVQIPSRSWQKSSVQIFNVPKKLWNEATFKQVMKSDSVLIEALGGVVTSDTARLTFNEIFERPIYVNESNLSVEINRVMKLLGWKFRGVNLPAVDLNPADISVSISSSGVASAEEAIAITRHIASLAKESISIRVQADRRTQTIEVLAKRFKEKL